MRISDWSSDVCSSDLHRPVDLRRYLEVLFLQQLIEPRQVLRGGAAGHMVQRQHGVGLAAAEVGLQFDDGVTAAPCQPLGCADQEGAEAVRQVGAARKSVV